MQGFPGRLKFAYAHHFFKMKGHISEMLAALIWSTGFEKALT